MQDSAGDQGKADGVSARGADPLAAEDSPGHSAEQTSPPQPSATHYRGRFAPSPTGPLHFGSLATALASCLDARYHHGTWLLRIENIDQPREVPGAASLIMHDLDRHGFVWDEPVVWQSDRLDAYAEALDELKTSHQAYPCACSRRDQTYSASGALVYPGNCRGGLPIGTTARSIRILTDHRPVAFDDWLQGHYSQDLEAECGDFVILRADGYYAYQLAVVVDDAWQGITHVVRGVDLLESTPRQLHLQSCLNKPTPRYAHLPIATDPQGLKLSKSTGAADLQTLQPGQNLWKALSWLRQNPPMELYGEAPGVVWDWAIQHWNIDWLRDIKTQPMVKNSGG
ncbi:tRNA glutamyl-Q(34) synthetase GluQRS [Acidihalobacter aeolianus]|uniref:tRNA glutamyl-Q(34) synthetase GluQRS n=1 Tax=Acidihalobacter aeolianus TaxID=2792603 RepID=UPI0009F5DA15|nr:tRNA glutamyl-Q(34) synthetase GluQRS [Acidihalobacter aeolianus]